ncbi:pirin family protein [Xanthomonas sp. NCPPB 3005]|uniref:pirin family protein n=1 Tax=Xanthomonas sp. NCPPB 3005 TaxID=3240913 RepID=UPI00355A2C7F
MDTPLSTAAPKIEVTRERPNVVVKSRGQTHGTITRLVSPGDIGQLIKPFVFLDRARLASNGNAFFGLHPHSGIATLTVVLQGGLEFQDSTGASGQVPTGGVEWMRAGAGAWHDGRVYTSESLRTFQLWLALPAHLEHAPPESRSIRADEIPSVGPARLILGDYGDAHGPIDGPPNVNYLHVVLKDGETWTYTPPAGHTVGFVAVDKGVLDCGVDVDEGEVAVFEESDQAITFVARGEASFVLGSAVKHPHDLVTGYYSVHTDPFALRKGEAEIQRVSRQLGRADNPRLSASY